MKKNIFKSMLLLVAMAMSCGSLWAEARAYVNYYGPETRQDGKYCSITWQTNAAGDVLINVGDGPHDGTGYTGVTWRGDCFEGSFDLFKVISAANGEENASVYFTRERSSADNYFILRRNTTPLPAGDITIKSTATLAWKCNENGSRWKDGNPTFEYAYGDNGSTTLSAPANVAVTPAGVVTFDAVAGANYYEVVASMDGVEFARQTIVSGGTFDFAARIAGTYDVQVVAKGINEGDAYSDAVSWTITDVLGSEYCIAAFGDGNAACAFSWKTLANGNVEIVLMEADGTVSTEAGHLTTFRSNAVNIANLKVGGVAASNYFTSNYEGNVQTLTLKDPANKPKLGTKISYDAMVTYKVYNNQDAWPTFKFNFTYGSTCAELHSMLPPANVAVSAGGVITFDAADGAETYEARIYRGAEKVYTQVVTSGATLNFTPMFTDTYQVKVISKADGQPNSEESDAADWTVTAPTFEAPAISEYCERVYNYNTNNGFSITFATVSGDVVITIGEGNDAHAVGTTVFRNNNGMSGASLAPFTVGPMKEPASVYFDRVFTNMTNTFTLKLKDGKSIPAGAKIYYNGTVEYATTGNGNAYGNYQFEYSYGTDCSALTVSAATNDAAKGSAKVEKDGVAASIVSVGDEVTFTAEAKPGCEFVSWTNKGEVVSTEAVYTTTVSETMNLIANFNYTRYAHVHEAMTVGGKTVYFTVGKLDETHYTIRWAGSATAPFAGINAANYVINQVKTDIDYPNPEADAAFLKKEGADIHFDNARWQFNDYGYGEAYITFELAEGKTIDDIYVWTRALTLNLVGGGTITVPVFFEDANRHNIDWEHTPVLDQEAPVFVDAETKATALNATSIEVEAKATDNWEGIITYTISYEGMVGAPIVVTAASGEKVSHVFEDLTQQMYNFTIVATDGVNATAEKQVSASPAADATAPTNVAISAQPITDQMVKLTVSADEDFAGDITFAVVATPAVVIAPVTSAPGEPKSFFVEGLNAGAEYSFTVTATNAAGLSAENAASATATTFAGNIALGKEAHAGHDDANAGLITDNDEGNRWSSNGATHPDNDWIYVDLGAVYDVAAASIKWEAARPANYVFEVSNDAENWTVAQTYSELMDANVFVPYLDLNAEGRYFRVRATATTGAYNNLGYGMSIYELRLYGALAADNVAPVVTSFTATGATKTSVLLTMNATDNFNGELTYDVYCGGVKKGSVNKQSGEEATYIVEGLEMQDYTFYFIVMDAAGNYTQSANATAGPVVDIVAPVPGEFVASEITFESVTLTLTATDNSNGMITYEVSLAGQLVATKTALSGENAVVTISGLNYLTAYNFSVVATDASDNAAEAVIVSATTLAPNYPIVAAPACEKRYPTDVMSVFSNSYETALAHGYNHNQWAGTVTCQDMDVDGNNFYFYTRNTGTETSWGENNEGANALVGKDGCHDVTTRGLDVRGMTYFHIDIWSATAGSLKVRILDDVLATVNLDGNGWNSFDLPLSAYANQAALSNVRWMKFTEISAGIQYFALDNGYFWRAKSAITIAQTENNTSVLEANDGKYVDVTVNRSFTAGALYTLCLPFSATAEQCETAFGAGYELKVLGDAYMKSADMIYLPFESVTSLEAGVPYLFTPAQDLDDLQFEGVEVSSATPAPRGNELCMMTGFVNPTVIPDYYLGADTYLHQNNSTNPTYAFRAYFTLGSSVPSNVRARIALTTETPTDIDAVEGASAEKFIEGGVLYIRKDGHIFNAQGQIVK